MIQSFASDGTRDIFNGRNNEEARKTCSRRLWHITGRKLDQIDSVTLLDELRIPPGNRMESLGRDRRVEYCIRINRQYRICFRWTDAGPEEVEIVDYH